MINEYIGNHKVIEKIGDEGTFGIVYKVIERDTDNNKAMKIFRSGYEKLEKERFIQENEILYKLSPHANIIEPLSKVLQHNSHIYYLLELADHNLSKYLSSASDILIDKALDIFIQICEGLKHAHLNKVAHRDLHANNVLMKVKDDNSNVIKLTDFGRARDFDKVSITRDYLPWGAIEISAPEIIAQLTNKNSSMEQQMLSDIYSLGIILHSLFYPVPMQYRNVIIELFNEAKNAGIYRNDCAAKKRKTMYEICLNRFALYDLKNCLRVILQIEQSINEKIDNLILSMSEPDYEKRISDLEDIIKQAKQIRLDISNAN